MVMTIITRKRPPSDPTFTVAGVRRGAVAALPFIVSNGAAGVVMGLAYKGLGLGFLQAVLFSLVVYSATAQAVILSLWTLPLPVGAMIVACVATNSRYLLMGAHLRPLFGGLRQRLMLPILFLLADASWLMTAADAERERPDAGYLLGASVPMAVGWVGGTAIAYGLPVSAGGPLKFAAALLPAMFIITLLPSQWRGARSVWAWWTSILVTSLAARFIDASWSMLIGGAFGTIVSMMTDDDE